jgi:UDP-2,3-diacylglucosamine hydrolase
MTIQPESQAIARENLAVDPAAGDAIALICGGGSFPSAGADAIVRRGRRPVMFAIRGWADPKVVQQYRHHWIALGQLGRFFRLARTEGCRDALFIGTLLRPAIRNLRLDWTTVRAMPRIVRSFRGGDDHLLSGVADILADGGLRIIAVHDVAPEILVPDGVLGRCQPNTRDRTDIARAFEVIAALGTFDIGQGAIVADNNVLAVEAAEGTDNMLARLIELRRLGRVTAPPGVGVLVKAPKPSQDRRFDLPAIGPGTIDYAARAGLAGVAVAAGSAIVADAAETIAAADRAGIFVAGVSRGAA